MEFEDQEDEEQEEEMELPAASDYDASRLLKMPGSAADAAATGGARRPACRYRECMKNHAVGIGGHAVDGCCEFMPAGADGTLDALRCAACGCHRNFHRKEAAEGDAPPAYHFHPHHHQPHALFSPYYRTPAAAGYLHMQRPLALPSTSGGAGSQGGEEQEDMSNPIFGRGAAAMMSPGGFSPGAAAGSSRKRFRTSFTAEQKERMLALAERMGWRIQKHDEALVQQFCEETGIKRHVLKVWMHNNKHNHCKKNENPS